MEKEKKNFSETRVYPIVFMVIVTIFFGSILAAFYHTTKERVENHARTRFNTALLSLFNLPAEENAFEQYIKMKSENQYIAYDEAGDLLGYCFDVKGSGLWGTIRLLMAVDADLETLIGIEILSQNETPGLGGRITEKQFLSQFSGKDIVDEGEVISYSLVPEGEPINKMQVSQITGATASSKAVVDMLYRNMKEIITNWEEKDE